MSQGSEHEAIPLGDNAASYPDAVVRAKLALQDANVPGPYWLILGPKSFRLMEASCTGYPVRKQLQQVVDGIILSRYIDGGFVVATEAKGLQLTVGQDFAIGYDSHTKEKIKLFLTESFTFRILDPRTFVPLKA